MKITFESSNMADLKANAHQREILELVDWESEHPNKLTAVTAYDFKERAWHVVTALTALLKDNLPQEFHEASEKAIYLLVHDYFMVQVCEQILIAHIHAESDKILPPEMKEKFISIIENYARTMR
jgi:aspartokinase